ncbi:MAG: hypothetical protein MUP40_06630 [Actinobacteria bacterium]|nr:hypothetical protein [Actinomycetota bacterium]
MVDICEEGLEEYPKVGILLGNLVMVVWIALGTIACYFFNHIVAWVYLGVAVTMVFVVLRRLICTNCYYYGRWCPTGWGKLSALLFKKGDIEKFGESLGLKLAPATYGLLTLTPLVLGTISAVQHFSAMKPVVLAAILIIGFYSGYIGRKKACAQCKMKLCCPGSVAK